MPTLDVTDVLDSPEFVDVFTVIRRSQIITDEGLAQDTPQTFANVGGVVVPNNDVSLNFLPEAEHLQGSISIYTRFRLSDGKSGIDADLVNWSGREYIVVTTGDYSRFGQGFIRAVAALNVVNPP
jgi:hypothetical protein